MKPSWCPSPNADSILRETQDIQRELNADCYLHDLNIICNLMTTTSRSNQENNVELPGWTERTIWSCLITDCHGGTELNLVTALGFYSMFLLGRINVGADVQKPIPSTLRSSGCKEYKDNRGSSLLSAKMCETCEDVGETLRIAI